MQTLLQDLKYAARTLAKSPAFTIIAVLTLALGIGANTAIFSIVKALLLDSLPYRHPGRLVTLAASDQETLNPTNVSFASVEDWKLRSHSFDSIALHRDWSPISNGGDISEITYGLRVSRNFFDTLGVQPALGRAFSPEEDRPKQWHVVMLSHSYWIRRFGGDPTVIGRTLLFDQVPFQVVGVLPQTFQSLSFTDEGHTPDIWSPLGYDLSLPYACRSCQHLRAVGRLKEGVNLAQARAEMNSIASQLAREFPKDYRADASVVVMPLRESWYGNVQAGLWLLLGATGLILLIACVNVGNLLLARAARKQREVALRAALGATRWRIVRQLLTESTLLSVLGAIAGILFAEWILASLVRWGPVDVPRLADVHFDYAIFLAALAISLAVGILTGLAPALQAARMDQREALQQTSRGSHGKSVGGLRGALVAIEVCLAFVLTFSAGLLLKSFVRATSVNPGFTVENLQGVNFALEGARYQEDPTVIRFEREALERIRAIPGVEAAGIVSTLPIGGSFDRRGFHVQDRPIPDADAPSVDAYYVSPGYLPAMGIRTIRGRPFTEDDVAAATPVALISEMTAHALWPGEDPLGKRIQLGGRDDTKPWATIVGIVGDVRQYALDIPPSPQAYELFLQNPIDRPIVMIRSTIAPSALMSAVKEQISAIDTSVPVYEPFQMTDLLSASLAQRRFTMTLLASFGVLAIVLAAIGIYGVMSSAVAQRTSEFGVRMALGAQATDILHLVSAEGLLRAGLGLLAGLALSVAISRILKSQLFEVSAIDPSTVVCSIFLVAAFAFAACYVPARRATRVDPMVALRYE
ncbi:MAG: ABC transporter permease [Candidatus Acidiferrales bacterium]